MNVKFFVFNRFGENSMIAYGGKAGACVAVDPAWCGSEERNLFFSFLEKERLRPEAILLTHCHFDHIFGVRELQDAYDIPVFASPDDKDVMEDKRIPVRMGLPSPDTSFKISPVHGEETIEAAGFSFKPIRTPGHTPGSICWREEKEGVLFSGDTLFAGSIGRTDLRGGDYDKLIVSLMNGLMGLPGETYVYPGHGTPTTIGTERATNPFLEPFNNPEDCQVSEDQSTSLR